MTPKRHESPKFAGKENGGKHQDSEAADIKNALDRPYRQLRGKAKILAPGNQVRANEFPGASKNGEACEPHQCGSNQSPGGSTLANWPKEYLPPQGT